MNDPSFMDAFEHKPLTFGLPRIDFTLPHMRRETPAPQRMPLVILVAGDLAGRDLPMPVEDRRPAPCGRGRLAAVRERLGVVTSRAVERRWDALGSLVAMADAAGNVEVNLLPVTAAELIADFEDVARIDRSGLFRTMITAEYGDWTGEPVGFVVLDASLIGDRYHAVMLQKVLMVCAEAHATVILPPSPTLAEPPLAEVLAGPLGPHVWVVDPVSGLADPIGIYGDHDVAALTDLRLIDAQVARSIKRLNVDRRQPILPQIQEWLDARTGVGPERAFREARAVEGAPVASLVPDSGGTYVHVAIDFVPGPLLPAVRRRVQVLKDRE